MSKLEWKLDTEQRGAHMAKTADPEAMSKRYLLDAIKEPA